MKRIAKSVLGVTLLEIMLVLAIAAMVIVMSVRYYQSAQSSSQANAYVSQIQSYVSAAENLAQGSSFANATKANMETLLPAGTAAWNLPWGGTGSYATTTTGFTFAPQQNPSAGTCLLIQSKMTGMTKMSVSSTTTCAVTYNAAL